MQSNDPDYAKLKWLLERLHSSEEYCLPYFERAKRHYKLYRFSTAVSDADWPYTNRVRSRDILAFVEDTTAILIQTLFATTPFFSILPRQTGSKSLEILGIDLLKVGQQMETVLDYQISHEDTDFLEEIVDYFKGGKIFGTSYIGVYPKFESDGSYFLPLLKTIDFWDVLPVVGSKRMAKSRGVFVREFVTKEDLLDAQKKGIYSKVDAIGSSTAGVDVQWHKDLMTDCGMTGYTFDDTDIEVIHYFSGGHIITIANRMAVLRDSTEAGAGGEINTPYPYSMPVVQFKDVPIPNEFFGIGIPEIIEVLQEDKNLVRSARRDNIDLCINKIIMTKEGTDINYDMIKFFPGAIWPEMMGKIEPLDIHDVTQSSYAEERQIQADMENALSLFGYARGMTPAHAEQPTTVMKLQQASLNRQDIAVKMAEFTVLQEIARKIIMLNRKYMTQETYESIIGEPDAGFYKLPPEYINRFYAVRPIGSSVSHIKEVRQQQIQFALDVAAKTPPEIMQGNVRPFTIDYLELIRTAFDAADIKNIDRILVPQQPQQADPLQMMLSDPNIVAQLAGVPYGQQNQGGQQ